MNPNGFSQIPFTFACDTPETPLLNYLQLLCICSLLSLLASDPYTGEAHLLFHRVFCFAERASDTEAECKRLHNSCDRCQTYATQGADTWETAQILQLCMQLQHVWYLCCQEKGESCWSNTRSAVKAVTIQAPCDTSALTAIQLFGIAFSLVAKISAWKLFSFSDSSESTWETPSSWLRDGVFTKFCFQLHVFNCKKAKAQVERKM